MVDIPLAITTLTNAIKLASDLRGIEREFDVAEYKLKIADLTTLLADVKIALTDARMEHAAKDAEIERLKAFLAKRDTETVEHHGYRYRKGEDGEPKGNPYCPVCEAKHGLLIQTTVVHEAGRPQQCPNCKAKYANVQRFP
jgi:rubrerythrin